MPTATPTMSVPQGTYNAAQTVTISDSTPGALIYYTTSGSIPTTSSSMYSAPIAVGATETVQAIAIAPGYSQSATASASYTISTTSADFQITTSVSTLSIAQGKSATATITITPQNGFGTQVSFGCGGLPSEATCNFSPVSITPNGSAQSSTLTIATTASTSMLNAPGEKRRISYAFLLPGFGIMLCVASRRRRVFSALRMMSVLLLLVAALGITSCGSGTASSPLFGNPGTPAGSAVVTVYGVSNDPTATTHMVFISVTVTK